MKKIFMMMLCLSIFTGCSNDSSKDQKDNDKSYNEISDKNDNQTNPSDTNDWYNRFETEMKNKSLNYSTKTSLDASTIGGAEGYRYATDNGNIDIYRFEDGDDFDKIVKDKKININNEDKSVEVNDHYVIVSDGLSDDVMSIFRDLK